MALGMRKVEKREEPKLRWDGVDRRSLKDVEALRQMLVELQLRPGVF